jgi:hypothetical protein
MIKNAQQARELSNASQHPALEETLEVIEYWASRGKYSVDLSLPIPEQLINNLKARGFGVFNNTITW